MIKHRELLRGLACLLLLPSLTIAQSLTPIAPEFPVHGPSGANQRDGSISWSSDGARVAYAWSAGQNIFMRLYDGDDGPLTGDLLVNDTIVSGNQDQPQVSIDPNGNVLVAWSDREANDGELIGIFARVYDSLGAPITAEFQVNVEFLASQFHPVIAPRNAGGWAVAWTGQFDGDCFFRMLDTNGVPTSGDVFVNSFDSGAQVNPDIVVLPNNLVFVAFEDASAQGGLGGGIHVWGRLFTQSGIPVGADFPLAPSTVNGDQRIPRVAVRPGSGEIFVVWEDSTNDGDGFGIYGRLFTTWGVPIFDEFRVNSDTSGNQRRPDVSVGPGGQFIVAWDSEALGGTEIRAQRFSGRVDFFGPEVTVSEVPQAGYLRAQVAMDPSTDEVLFSYDGPGAADDFFTRRFSATCVSNVTGYCTTSPNSVGTGTLISSRGTTSIAANDFELSVTNSVPNSFGLFFYGPNQVNVPLFNGVRCVGGGITRLGGAGSDGSGNASRVINYGQFAPIDRVITAGSTWNFQYVYRDTVGALLNYSDALSATFCP